jgi:hypothetical protein
MAETATVKEASIVMSGRPGAERRGGRRRWLALVLSLPLLLSLSGVVVSSAAGSVPIYSLEAKALATQAGAHADTETNFVVGTRFTEPDVPCECTDARELTVHLPAGVIGNPHVVPACTSVEFAKFDCPVDSQVGLDDLALGGPGGLTILVPVYNIEPGPNEAGALGIATPLLFTPPIRIVLSPRTESDYGLDATITGITQVLPLYSSELFLWGVPADPVHDPLRMARSFELAEETGFYTPYGCAADPAPEIEQNLWPSVACAPPDPNGPYHTNIPPEPFLSNPTECRGPLSVTLDVTAFDFGSDTATAPYPETTGCALLSFNPSLAAQPTTASADSASGLDVDLNVPQFQDPNIPSPSAIKNTEVTLPPGFTVNPNAADGKTACPDEAAKFGTRDKAECPEHAKIGTLTIVSSALPGPLPGYLYLGAPLPGNRYRVFLVADGFAVHIKLAGSIILDPKTGQVRISFKDLPEAPFEDFRLHIFGSERGILATPTQCAKYSVKTTFTPWDSELPEQESTQFFSLDSGPEGDPCPGAERPFEPKMEAGTTDNTGGSHSTFSFDLARNDGDQNLTAVDVETPPGFSATIAGIPYCSDAALNQAASEGSSGVGEQSTPSCPPASKIGETNTKAGAGSRPVSLPGSVYLAGPYKGAPLSLAVVTPAVSGPYDLGNVVVRVALHVDPSDAHITAVSDPLPAIVDGIPLRIRDVRVELNRSEFALNPTNCSPFSVNATVLGDQGASKTLSNRFQVANCGSLKYRPRLNLRLSGGVNRLGHPRIHAIFRTKATEANSRRISVTLPHGELLDNSHIGTVCTKPDFAANNCPQASLLGSVEARSPLLDEPLRGNVYLRASAVHELPDMVLDLKGQIDIEAVAKIDSVRGRLRATFEGIPDVPVGTVVLNLAGGSKGLLQNSEGLCGAGKRAIARMSGQNGAVRRIAVPLKPACGSTRSKHRRAHHRGHGRTRRR